MMEEGQGSRAHGNSFSVPRGACDCHVHVFDGERFPYADGRTYTPADASVEALNSFRQRLGIDRVVLVQPSVYGADNGCLLAALATIGPEAARGVAVIDPEHVTDEELDQLRRAGVRAVRVNLESRGDVAAGSARRMLAAVHDRVLPFRLAIQIYAELPLIIELADQIAQLSAPVVLDHFAGANAALGVGQPGFSRLLELLQGGHVWIKLSAVYRVSRQGFPYDDVSPIAEALISANPDRLVWASDWPHTGSAAGRKTRSPKDIEPFREIDDAHVLGLLSKWSRDASVHRRILVDNAGKLFDFPGGTFSSSSHSFQGKRRT